MRNTRLVTCGNPDCAAQFEDALRGSRVFCSKMCATTVNKVIRKQGTKRKRFAGCGKKSTNGRKRLFALSESGSAMRVNPR